MENLGTWGTRTSTGENQQKEPCSVMGSERVGTNRWGTYGAEVHVARMLGPNNVLPTNGFSGEEQKNTKSDSLLAGRRFRWNGAEVDDKAHGHGRFEHVDGDAGAP